MTRSVEVLLSPADWKARAGSWKQDTLRIVFDVLRATTTMLTALSHGAEGILPVESIPEALTQANRFPGAQLAGERHGLRLESADTGGRAFDLGNSPREMTEERVAGKLLVMTTTNGTAALASARGPGAVAIGGFRHLGALADFIRNRQENLCLICAGTGEGSALEDVAAAGALLERMQSMQGEDWLLQDNAQLALQAWIGMSGDYPRSIERASNAQRLLSMPALAEDVGFCLQVDVESVLGQLDEAGWIRRLDQVPG